MKNGNPASHPQPPNLAADILLVEDDPGDAELTMVALRECGWGDRVEQFSDGSEALDYIACTGAFANRHPPTMPRLILLDLGLQTTGGMHVLRHLKTDERTRGIPIVVLTGSRLAIELVESYRLGVNSYVIKPGSAREFTKIVSLIATYWLTVNEPSPR